MNVDRVLQNLRASGSEKNRTLYSRLGVREPLFGVSYSDQKKLVKRIRVDHDLARALWATGNHDARVLATMIADPDAATGGLLDKWAADLDNHVLTDAFSVLAGRSPVVMSRMKKWTASSNEWVARTGWSLLAQMAMRDPTMDDGLFTDYIKLIEAGIHTAGNRARDAMNSALIAIGMRNGRLRAQAIAAARRIGGLDVDQGATHCRTPDPETYVRKTAVRLKS